MSRHGYTFVFFPTMRHLLAAFEAYAPDVERALSPAERYVNGHYESAGHVHAWGDSLLGADAVAHAAATVEQSNQRWWSQIDPRTEADGQIAELVRAIWHAVIAGGDYPTQPVASLPSRPFEERPNTIPRVTGVRYYPTSSLTGFISTPRGHQYAVAVRDAEVPDDWEHVTGVADPAGFDAEPGHHDDLPGHDPH